MSHLVKQKSSMNDLETLLSDAKSLGWRVEQDQRVQYFSGQGEMCQYVLWLDGEVNDSQLELGHKYNIGIQIEEDKEISLLHDDAMNGRDVMYNGEHDPCT